MNAFVEKFKTDIECFWKLNENEQNKILRKILSYANSNPKKFIEEINQVKFDRNLTILPLISEALSSETEKWGHYYIDLLDSIIKTAKTTKKPYFILSNVLEYVYIENNTRPFVQKIVTRLYEELKSENIDIRIMAIWQLPDYLTNPSIKNKDSIIKRLQQQLYERHWKIRVSAFESLSVNEIIPDEFKMSFKDKIFKFVLGNPPTY